MDLPGPGPGTARPRRFDVICAGEPHWRAMSPFGETLISPPNAGLLRVTRVLAQASLQVAMVTALEDSRWGRASLAEMAALRVDVRAVKLVPAATELVVVDAVGGRFNVLSEPSHDEVEVPAAWSSQVMLLSGLSAVTSKLAVLCKAARRARREGSVVVVDMVGSLRHWAGREPRVIAMVLREADVVRCSFVDLATIGMDVAAVRRAMRPDATIVINDARGTVAAGAFGEVRAPSTDASAYAQDLVEGCTVAICVEHARPRRASETTSARWHRIMRDEAPRMAASLREP